PLRAAGRRLAWAPGRAAEPPFDPPGGGRPPRIFDVVAHAPHDLPRLVTGLELREPAVGDLRHALEHGLGHAAEPHRNGALDGQRIDALTIELMKGALEGHQRLDPELAHDRDLLGDAPAARVKI